MVIQCDYRSLDWWKKVSGLEKNRGKKVENYTGKKSEMVRNQ